MTRTHEMQKLLPHSQPRKRIAMCTLAGCAFALLAVNMYNGTQHTFQKLDEKDVTVHSPPSTLVRAADVLNATTKMSKTTLDRAAVAKATVAADVLNATTKTTPEKAGMAKATAEKVGASSKSQVKKAAMVQKYADNARSTGAPTTVFDLSDTSATHGFALQCGKRNSCGRTYWTEGYQNGSVVWRAPIVPPSKTPIGSSLERYSECIALEVGCGLNQRSKSTLANGASYDTVIESVVSNDKVVVGTSLPNGMLLGSVRTPLRLKVTDIKTTILRKSQTLSTSVMGSLSFFQNDRMMLPEMSFVTTGSKTGLRLLASHSEPGWIHDVLGLPFFHIEGLAVAGSLTLDMTTVEFDLESSWCIGALADCVGGDSVSSIRGKSHATITAKRASMNAKSDNALSLRMGMHVDGVSISQILRAIKTQLPAAKQLADALGDIGTISVDNVQIDVYVSRGAVSLQISLSIPNLGEFAFVAVLHDGQKAFAFQATVKDVGGILDAIVQPIAPNGLAPTLLKEANGKLSFKWCTARCKAMFSGAFITHTNLWNSMANGLTLAASGAVPTDCGNSPSAVMCNILSGMGASSYSASIVLASMSDMATLQIDIAAHPGVSAALCYGDDIAPAIKLGACDEQQDTFFSVEAHSLQLALKATVVDSSANSAITILQPRCDCKYSRVSTHAFSGADSNRFSEKALCEFDPTKVHPTAAFSARRAQTQDVEFARDACAFAKDGICDEDPNTETISKSYWKDCESCVNQVDSNYEQLKHLARTIDCSTVTCGAREYMTTVAADGATRRMRVAQDGRCGANQTRKSDGNLTAADGVVGSRNVDANCVHCFWGTDTTDCGERPFPIQSSSQDVHVMPPEDGSDLRTACNAFEEESECINHASVFRTQDSHNLQSVTDRICEWKDAKTLQFEATLSVRGAIRALNDRLTIPSVQLIVEHGTGGTFFKVPTTEIKSRKGSNGTSIHFQSSVSKMLSDASRAFAGGSIGGKVQLLPKISAELEGSATVQWSVPTACSDSELVCKLFRTFETSSVTLDTDIHLKIPKLSDSKLAFVAKPDNAVWKIPADGTSAGKIATFSLHSVAFSINDGVTDHSASVLAGMALSDGAIAFDEVEMTLSSKDGRPTLAVSTSFVETETGGSISSFMGFTGLHISNIVVHGTVRLTPFEADVTMEFTYCLGTKSHCDDGKADHTVVGSGSLSWIKTADSVDITGTLDIKETTLGAIIRALFPSAAESMLALTKPDTKVDGSAISFSCDSDGNRFLYGTIGLPGSISLSFASIQQDAESLHIAEVGVGSIGEILGKLDTTSSLSDSILGDATAGGSVTWKAGNSTLLSDATSATHPTWPSLSEGVSFSVSTAIPIPAECKTVDLVCNTFQLFDTTEISTKLNWSPANKLVDVLVTPDHADLGFCMSVPPTKCENKFTLVEFHPIAVLLELHTDTRASKLTAWTGTSLLNGLIALPPLATVLESGEITFADSDTLPALLKEQYALDSNEWSTWLPGFGLQFKGPAVSGAITMQPFSLDIKVGSGWCFGSMANCQVDSSAKTIHGAATVAFKTTAASIELGCEKLTLARLVYGALDGLLPEVASKMVELLGIAGDMGIKDVRGKLEMPPLSAEMTAEDLLKKSSISLAGSTIPPNCPADGSKSQIETFVACALSMAVPSITSSIALSPGMLKLSVGSAMKRISPSEIPFSKFGIGKKPINLDSGLPDSQNPVGTWETWEPPELWLRTEGGTGMAFFVELDWSKPLPTLALGAETGLWFCGQRHCDYNQYIKFYGAGQVSIDATSTAAIGVQLKMNNWWWNVGFSGLTRGLDIPDAAFKFLHFGNAVLEADIGINIAAAVASGGIGAVVPVVKMVKIGGSACIGSVCDCAKLANQAREGCDATNSQLGGSSYAYVGCFADNTNGRDLPISTAALTSVDRESSLTDCVGQCAGYEYMGLQWTSECYCGNSYGSQGSAECPDDCGLPTSGNGCGGRNAIYSVTGPPPADAVMGESYLSFSVDDPKSIAFTASLSKITFGMVINSFGFDGMLMNLIPKFLLENDSGMYPTAGKDFATIQFSLLGSEVGAAKIPPGLAISGAAKMQLFGKTLAADGIVMANLFGLIFAMKLPKLQIGKALTICKTAECDGDFGPMFYSHIGKPDVSHDPVAFGASHCTDSSLFCLEMVGHVSMDALGISSACTIEYTPLSWLLRTEAKMLNMKFFVEISFSLSFTDGMDYAFKAKLNPDELTHQQQLLNQFFDRFPLAKNRFQLTAMEVSGSISVDGEGVQVVAKAYVHAKFGDKEVELNFDVNIQHDHDVIIKAIENKLQEMFPWAFVDKCAHNDRKQRNNDKCKCGLSICDAGKYCDNTNLITQCHDEPFCANTDRKNRNTERCNCGLGNICDANKYCKWGQCFDDVWKPPWQSDSRRRRSGF